MEKGKKIYFASDFHLGVPDKKSSLDREKRIVRWLDEVSADAEEIFLVGDVFDFWYEYRTAIPKGFVRIQGKIAELTDRGIKVHYFIGNHDMWAFKYWYWNCQFLEFEKSKGKSWNGRKISRRRKRMAGQLL